MSRDVFGSDREPCHYRCQQNVSDKRRQLPLSKNIACLLRQCACSTELRTEVQSCHKIKYFQVRIFIFKKFSKKKKNTFSQAERVKYFRNTRLEYSVNVVKMNWVRRIKLLQRKTCRGFFASVRNGPGTHSACCTMGMGHSRVKAARAKP